MHWIVAAGPIFWFFVFLGAVHWLLFSGRINWLLSLLGPRGLHWLGIGLFGFGAIWAVFHLIRWNVSRVSTDGRTISWRWLLTEDTMQLFGMREVNIRRSLLGAILGYGTLRLDSSLGMIKNIDFLPNANHWRDTIIKNRSIFNG
jgi:hypothetical protein